MLRYVMGGHQRSFIRISLIGNEVSVLLTWVLSIIMKYYKNDQAMSMSESVKKTCS